MTKSQSLNIDCVAMLGYSGDCVDRRVIYAVIAGIVLYVLLVCLAYVERDLTGSQLVLMLVTPLVVGVLSGGVKKGVIVGFVVSFIMLLVEVIVLQSGAFSDVNVVAAVIIMMVLPWALTSAGLGAVGGLVGRRIFKK
jgi:hypothetical protein